MPPKPLPGASGAPKPQVISAAVKAAAAASKVIGVGGPSSSTIGIASSKQPPKKKKTVVKAKRPGSTGPVVVIGKDDTLHPTSKLGVMKNKPIISKPTSLTSATSRAAVDSIQFSSQYSSPKKKASGSSNTAGSSATASSGGSNIGGSSGGVSKVTVPNSAAQLNQFKLEKAQIAKRELAEMDAIERAFREDENVWTGPKNVVYPKRYHPNKEGEFVLEQNKEGDSGEKKSSISNPYMSFYGSQSQGWMYGEGYAGIGGRSWAEVTSNSNTSDNNEKDKKSDEASTPKLVDDTATPTDDKPKNASFLMDDVTIIENSLKANGLTRKDLTPKAYACFLEQARRYALELLADAQDYAIHAQRNTIPSLIPADLLLAVEMRDDGGGSNGGGVPSTLPTPEQISELASEVNRAPLPPIPVNCYNGVALPPVEHQLTARTYDVVNGARVAQRMMRGGDLPSSSIDLRLSSSGSKKKGSNVGGDGSPSKKKKVASYGASKGRQIAVHIKKPGSSASSDGGAAALPAASGKSAATSKSGSTKVQKRKLTEL